ncbi:hypothetical protein IID10_14940 [candidate division KSB1 bacterium]|nr:hypothetical protein [candidate division KSB1 bacterium]
MSDKSEEAFVSLSNTRFSKEEFVTVVQPLPDIEVKTPLASRMLYNIVATDYSVPADEEEDNRNGDH